MSNIPLQKSTPTITSEDLPCVQEQTLMDLENEYIDLKVDLEEKQDLEEKEDFGETQKGNLETQMDHLISEKTYQIKSDKLEQEVKRLQEQNQQLQIENDDLAKKFYELEVLEASSSGKLARAEVECQELKKQSSWVVIYSRFLLLLLFLFLFTLAYSPLAITLHKVKDLSKNQVPGQQYHLLDHSRQSSRTSEPLIVDVKSISTADVHSSTSSPWDAPLSTPSNTRATSSEHSEPIFSNADASNLRVHHALNYRSNLPTFAKKISMKGFQSTFKMVAYEVKDDRFISQELQSGLEAYFSKPTIEKLFRPHLAKKNMIDIGANIGGLCTPWAELLRHTGGMIFCVEADPSNFGVLFSNMVLNGLTNMYVSNYAVTDDTKKQPFVTMKVEETNRGHSSVLQLPNFHDDTVNSVQVPTMTIDSLYNKYPDEMCQVGSMKIDVEGYEGHVLFGAEKYLRDCPPCFVFAELDDEWLTLAGTPVADIIIFMRKFGFELDNPYVSRNDYEWIRDSPECS